MVRDGIGSGKIHYRLNSGAWQVISGRDTSFTIGSDGVYIVEYYSEDALGNAEATHSFNIQIDQTPSSLPVNLQESHGLVSDGWQKDQNIPAFTWDAASDATSGIRGYQFYFGYDPDGIGYRNILASEPRQWTPFPAGLPTGTSYLRARTQDNAGNWSEWASLFTFRYDNTPPENPLEVTHAEGITTAWQNATSTADFSWSTAHDEGSGIKGYHVYWGGDPDAVGAEFITADAYQNLTSLCAANSVCTGYLRLRSEDNVGNLAEDWNTVFILRYDNIAPLVDFSFNGGAADTTQSQVRLDITSSDEGSGVYAARFSADGQNWTEWEEPVDERLWNIQPISRQSWPVYAQVKDGVGLLSEIARHDVYLDVNPAQPSSLNYRLFDHSLSGGSGAYGSANYSGRGTLSQVADSPSAASAHYTLWNGYEAGSQSIPLIVPGHEEYTLDKCDTQPQGQCGSFTSGVVSAPLESANYRMILTVGEIGLPVMTTINSASYQHQPGFLAGVLPEQLEPPADPQPVVQIEMPAPDPEPLPTCDAPSVSINAGALYTDNPSATLSLCAPYAVETMISDQEDFAGAVWEPFGFTRSWVIPASGSTVKPHFVYAQFKDADGKIYATYFDDILYDPNQPGGSLLLSDDIVAPAQASAAQMNVMGASASALTLPTSSTSSPTLEIAADGSVTLYIDGYDDNSGVTQMQLSADANFTAAVWQPFSPKVSYIPEGENGPKTVHARFQDDAGNISGTTTIDFIYDTQPPLGYVYVDPSVLPGDAVTATLYLGDYSTWDETYDGETPPAPTFDGGAVEMRLGSDPDLLNAYWEPLTDSVTLAIDPSQPEGTFYAQFRDAAGNISEISSATYQIDTLAPDLSAMAEPGEGSDRVINIYANDDLSGVANLYLSNDPLMEQNVTTQAYADTLTWTFDDNKVLWIVAEDGVGNRTEPYPVYATEKILTISGNAGAAGTTITYTGGSTTADESGNYFFTVTSKWTGTVTPSKTGYTFSPASRDYSAISSDQVNQDYTAAQNEYSLTINKVGNGTVTADKSAPYLNGSAVQLSAAADIGWTFAGWSGDCAGAGACNITMDGNKSVTATFAQNAHTLTINKVGNGSVTPDLPAPYYHGVVVQLSATADTGWTFTGWGGACSGNLACTVTMNSDQSITATFTQNVHTLTINTSGNGTVTADKPAPYHYGDIVHLSATANTSWTFTGWSGACTASPCSITMDGDKSVTATFTQPVYALTITKVGNGTVTVDKPAPYHYGDVVQLTPTADNGWSFSSWSGDCAGTGACTVTMNGDKSVTAAFTQNEYILTITKVGNGTVIADKPAPYHYGDTVRLTATADNGWVFSSWNGDCTASPCSITIDGDKSVTVTFRQELVNNGGFNLYKGASKIPLNWVKNLSFGSKDGKDTKVKQEGLASVRIFGLVDKVKTLTQTLYLSGSAGQPFTFSYWVKASLAPKAGVCQGQVLFYNGKKLVGTKTLKCPTGKTYNWTHTTLELTAPPAYTKVLIKFTYSKASGKVWFDWVSLLK
jgi:uncharacterized repeat protein (TIGR02543 family)